MKPKSHSVIFPRRPQKRPKNTADLRSLVQKATRRHQKFIETIEKCHEKIECRGPKPEDENSVKTFDKELWERRIQKYLKVEEAGRAAARNPKYPKRVFFRSKEDLDRQERSEIASSLVAKRPFVNLSVYGYNFRGLIDTGKNQNESTCENTC